MAHVRILCSPAECYRECPDPHCPYTHQTTWYAAGTEDHYPTEQAAYEAHDLTWPPGLCDDEPPEDMDDHVEGYEETRRRKIAEANEF